MALIGDIYRLPDLLTGFSENPAKVRWSMVVVVDRISVRVVPRSKTGHDGVYVPIEAMPGHFTEPGRFFDDWKSVTVADLRRYECVGRLPEQWRAQVLAQYHENQRRRRERRRRRGDGGPS